MNSRVIQTSDSAEQPVHINQPKYNRRVLVRRGRLSEINSVFFLRFCTLRIQRRKTRHLLSKTLGNRTTTPQKFVCTSRNEVSVCVVLPVKVNSVDLG